MEVVTSTLDHPADAASRHPREVTPGAAGPVPPTATVLAVLVADAGAGNAAVASTLAAVGRQTRRPDGVVLAAADTDADADPEADAVPGLDAARRDRLGAVDVVVSPAGGLADLVRAAVMTQDVSGLTPRPDTLVEREDPAGAGTAGGPTGDAATAAQWLWLLPAGCLPAPDALERQLAAVTGDDVGLVGCKQRRAGGRELLGVGLSTSAAGRPITGVDPGEVDQGQLDDRDDVLAVAVPGTLVRRAVWDALGGADPWLDGRGGTTAVDLGRRVRRAGGRVVVVPGAVVALPDPPPPATAVPSDGEAEESAPAVAGALAGPDVPAARRDLVHLRLVSCSAAAVPLVVLQVLTGCALRVVGRVADGHVREAGAEVAAVAAVLLRPDRLRLARRIEARTARRPRRELRSLLVDRRAVLRWHRDRRLWRRVGATRTSTRLGEAPVAAGGDVARAQALGLVACTAVLTGVAALVLRAPLTDAIAGRTLAAGPDGGLAGLPGSSATLWQAATSSWVPGGPGAAATPDPLLSVLAALSLPFGASPPTALAVLLLAAVPLAGLSGWVGAGAVTRSVVLRALAAAAWAAAPALLVSLDGGRTGAVLAHLVLPLAARALLVAVEPQGRRPWAAAAAAGLLLAVACAAAPVLLPAVVIVVVGVVVAGGSRFARRLPLLLVPLPALAVLAPLLPTLLRSPATLLAAPGPPVPTGAVPGWLLLLGWPADPLSTAGALTSPYGGAVVATVVAAAVLLVVAAVALARGGRAGSAARTGWVLLGLGVATAVAAVLLGTRVGGAAAGAWPAAGTSLGLLGLLAAALAGTATGDGPGGDGRGRRDPLRRRLLAGTAVALVLLPVAGLGTWVLARTAGPGDLAGSGGLVAAPDLPAVAADAAASPRRTRTLVLSETGRSVTWTLADTGAPSMTAASAAVRQDPDGAPSGPADAAVARTVAALASSQADAGSLLGDLGIGYVLLQGDATDGLAEDGTPRDDVALTDTTLDAAPGLTRAGETDDARLWRVVAAPPADSTAGTDGAASTDGAVGTDDAEGLGERVRLLAEDGTRLQEVPVASAPGAPVAVATDVPSGEVGRRVALGERADPGWVATLDGRALNADVQGGWAQAFELGPEGGRLVVSRTEALPGWTGPARLAVLALAGLLVLALPGHRMVRS